jgi:outer membrane protein
VKRSFWLAPVAVLSFGAIAQESGTKLGFVSVNALIQATPEGQAVLEIRRAASEELQPIQSQLETYNKQAQAGTLSEADRAQANLVQLDYSQKIQEFQAKLDAAYSSFSQAIDPAIAQSAKDQGFAVVMNSELAASSGLVIYADLDTTNLTEDVKAKLQAK